MEAPPAAAEEEAGTSLLSSQDKVLPIANVARIMKRALPGNAKVANDAKECMQECVTEFILFITSEASERCATEKRKTITGEDILWAMTALSFDYYVEPLRLYLQRWRDAEKQHAKRANKETSMEAISFPVTFPFDKSSANNGSGAGVAASSATSGVAASRMQDDASESQSSEQNVTH